ncbi:MAG: tRNA uridine-5-carboxymethylaminomethyl(34) synthesis GTPase MnmE [Eubacteriales bacterium]|nr:tRNA uridine-5-carboxymethylaminomethyl(34) synthesis GTPase MnmE [Eubacteriales bacterium]
MKSDTIAAIATALSDSGIGIIRISGPDALEVADKVFQTKGGSHIFKSFQTHTIHYGYIADQGEIIDEVMISLMKEPRSYTKEDTVEISCHGGVLLMRRVLETVLKNGARLAEPGEFTKRAFLNGRIDLSKAEAVMDLIHSKNEFALKSSVKQLRGSVSDEIKSLRAAILYEIAFIESALDDPEHISTEGYPEKLSEIVDELLTRLKKLLDSADDGKMRKEGINTVIVGKPNAGKSSLLNILVGEEKAIVTDVAGTTRDILEESIRLHGIGLNIIDTAGIRRTDDVVEKIGVERARKYAQEADLILYVVDSSLPLDDSDRQIMDMISGKKTIILLNKTDLESVVTEESLKEAIGSGSEKMRMIRTSTKENKGIDEFEKAVSEMFFHGQLQTDDEVVITNMRHKEAIRNAYESLLMVKKSLEDQMPEDFYSIDLMNAYASLGYIIGEEVGEDLVNEIFSKFCMGK